MAIGDRTLTAGADATPPTLDALVRMALGLAAWAALIAVALRRGQRWREERPEMKIRAAPFFGRWETEVASVAGLVAALALGLAMVVLGTKLWTRVPWRAVVGGVAVVAVGWLLALNAVDGPHALVEPVQDRHEYIAGIPDVEAAGGPRPFLRTFTEEIDAYPIHVRGHPPGLVTALWAADDLGLEPEVVSVGSVLVGWAVAVASALVALRATAGEAAARRAAPFLALVPGAVWAGTSFDALFAGLVGAGVAAVVVATTRSGRRALVLAGAGGVAIGAALLLSYSVAPVIGITVVVALRHRRPAPLVTAGATAVAVLVAMGLAGFWWPDGLAATREQYQSGVATLRPFSYFVVANIAVVAVTTGPVLAAGLATVGRRIVGPAILLAGALLAVAGADLSGLSKGEVERIWLPMVPWLATAAAFVPEGRWWPRLLLAAQVAVAVTMQVMLRTPW